MALPPVPPSATTPLTRTVLAPNPGPMTLDGTNSYVIGRLGSTAPAVGAVIVDPGPADERHLAALGAAGDVQLILITHRHSDHTEGAARLHEMTGAPVRAADPAQCHGGGEPLAGPERIEVAGLVIEVVPTPGHTDDSISFFLPDDGDAGSMLTGDTILGRGTTVIAHPEGSVADYLATLDTLQGYGGTRVLPAHGPQLESLAQICQQYRAHRLERLDQIRAVLGRLGPEATADQVVDAVYTDTPPQVRFAALKSVAAQLEYLNSQTG